MKKRSGYWWLFVTSGIIWAIGILGTVTGMILYPESNLLGGFGPLFWLPGTIGSTIFQVTLLIWLIQKLIRWIKMKQKNSQQSGGEVRD